jgi:hypothetical protein
MTLRGQNGFWAESGPRAGCIARLPFWLAAQTSKRRSADVPAGTLRASVP